MNPEFMQATLARLEEIERRLERLETREPNIATLALRDGITAPSAVPGQVQLYVDLVDGEIKAIDGDGNIDTLSSGL